MSGLQVRVDPDIYDSEGRITERFCSGCLTMKSINEFYWIAVYGLYRRRCQICVSRSTRIYHYRTRAYARDYEKEHSWLIKLETLAAYGSICACCSEANNHFLQIDHINGGGCRQRRENKIQAGTQFYKWLRRQGYPDGYQVLCANCNSAFGHYGACPHKTSISGLASSHKPYVTYHARLKRSALEAYGNICQCCEEDNIYFLQIDHIKGRGHQHLQRLGIRPGGPFYQYLKRKNYPKGFRVLCVNCNTSLGFYGICPHHHSGRQLKLFRGEALSMPGS